jgi:exopolysaccharide biosynthesis operon protein EpsL
MKESSIRFLASVLLLVSPFAFAQDRPVFAVRAGASVSWDSNVFLLPSSANPLDQLGTSTKSDTVTSAFAGISLDKRYSLQRFYLDATETAYRHANFSYLDFDALQYSGGWDWRVGPRLSGTLSADRSEALVNYGDFRNTSVLNTVTSEHRRASLDGWVSGGWHVLLAGTQDVSKNSVPFVQVASFRASGGDAGIKYLWETGSSVELRTASARGDYLNQPLDPVNLIDNGFRRSENYALASLALSAISSLNARLGWVNYRSSNFAQRDFSGTVGTLGYQWRPTGKLSLALTAARDRTPYTDSLSSYVVADTLSIAPSWQLSAKTALVATLSQTSSDYRGAVVTSAGPLRHDDLSSAQLGLNWTPLRSVTVGASLRHQHRSSNSAGFDFDDTGASLSASILF